MGYPSTGHKAEPSPVSNEPGLFTEDQAAAWLQITPRQLRDLRYRRLIEYSRVGSKPRFTIEQLRRFVDRNTVGGGR